MGTRTRIIIPSWNGRDHLVQCLPALTRQTTSDFSIVVVDNGSQDGTVSWLRTTYPDIAIVELSRNHGFAAACNAGIRVTTSPLILLLNNDTVVEEHLVATLVQAADTYPDVGMFAATLWLNNESPTVDAAGIGVDRLGIAWNVARGSPTDRLPATSRPIFGPCAGAALYRRDLFADIGLFDEAYFAYLEDVELAWRARWAGWHARWIPGAIVWHAHSATGGRTPTLKYWLLGRNRIWTLLRHYPRPHLWYYAPLILLNELAAGVLGSIALHHPAPLFGRLAALREWRTAVHLDETAPRRLTSDEMFAHLAPVGTPAAILNRYRSGQGIPFPDSAQPP